MNKDDTNDFYPRLAAGPESIRVQQMHMQELDMYNICETENVKKEGGFKLGRLDHDLLARARGT